MEVVGNSFYTVNLQLSPAHKNPSYSMNLNWVIAKETYLQPLAGMNVCCCSKRGMMGMHPDFILLGTKDMIPQSYEPPTPTSFSPSFPLRSRVWTQGFVSARQSLHYWTILSNPRKFTSSDFYYWSVEPYLALSVCPSVRPSIYLSVRLSVFISEGDYSILS